MIDRLPRRTALLSAGLAAIATLFASGAKAAVLPSLEPEGASELQALTQALARAPRRREFKTVPMILDDPSLWDHDALQLVLTYRGEPKQVFDNSDITAPWLNLMRNALNGQIWAYKHPNALVVSGTHGRAHLGLLDQVMWDKYKLANLAGDKFPTNTMALETKAGAADPANYEAPEGAYSSKDASIPALQRRGVVFLACHNTLWEQTEKLVASGVNPDNKSAPEIVAELTNHLLSDVVLTPGLVATLAELSRAGFSYVK